MKILIINSVKSLTEISILRIWNLMIKEFKLIIRDKGTIAILVAMPLIQITLFGFAIKIDPKHLPIAIINYDHSPLTRAFIGDLQASTYFELVDTSNDFRKAKDNLATGKVSFIITIPENFTHDYISGKNPQLLVEMDGTDPGSSGTAFGVFQPILDQSLNDFNRNRLGVKSNNPRTYELILHRSFNEANKSEFDIIPGIIGVLISMTMVVVTSSGITKENDDGTMEMLLATPLRPIEIIIGKVLPYIVLGYMQLTAILIYSKLLINLPMEGSITLLYLVSAPFILANLMIGMIFSTLATTPMQAMQLSMLYQLPAMLLSGYFFSFFGMPKWAQLIGETFPLTYFMRICRGILLKNTELTQILPNLYPMCFIAIIFIILASLIFRQTLD